MVKSKKWPGEHTLEMGKEANRSLNWFSYIYKVYKNCFLWTFKWVSPWVYVSLSLRGTGNRWRCFITTSPYPLMTCCIFNQPQGKFSGVLNIYFIISYNYPITLKACWVQYAPIHSRVGFFFFSPRLLTWVCGGICDINKEKDLLSRDYMLWRIPKPLSNYKESMKPVFDVIPFSTSPFPFFFLLLLKRNHFF